MNEYQTIQYLPEAQLNLPPQADIKRRSDDLINRFREAGDSSNIWAVEKIGMGASGSGQTSVGVETTIHCKYLAEAVCRYEVNTQE